MRTIEEKMSFRASGLELKLNQDQMKMLGIEKVEAFGDGYIYKRGNQRYFGLQSGDGVMIRFKYEIPER